MGTVGGIWEESGGEDQYDQIILHEIYKGQKQWNKKTLNKYIEWEVVNQKRNTVVHNQTDNNKVFKWKKKETHNLKTF